jgi:stearoyl-CoA desaturase (delta-9 desaturase)
MQTLVKLEHRINVRSETDLIVGAVQYSWRKSLWFTSMAAGAIVGGALTFRWPAVLLFVLSTASVLLFGHSLGSHRKLIHNTFACPKWLEYLLVYCGVQVGLAGPLGLLRQHELRDYAQRLRDCHSYLRHGESFARDFWWQVHCDLHLANEPELRLESRVADDRFYRFLERTWMFQQLPVAAALFLWGGWAFVWWGGCARVTAGILGHWLIGHFAHNHGDMSYVVKGAAVQGRNVRFVSLLTMGECWHNNHHAFPGSAKLGLHAGEWDPGWWTLQALAWVGLAWSFRLPSDLPARAAVECRRQQRGDAADQTSWCWSGPARWLPESTFRFLTDGCFVLAEGRRLVLVSGASFIAKLQNACHSKGKGETYAPL